MEFRILGPLEVVHDGRSLALGGVRPRAVLAILLMNANQVVSVDRLVDDVWDGRPPETAVHAIQVYVSQLRKSLTPEGGDSRIVTRAAGYQLDVGAEELDLHRFERLLAAGRDALAAGDARRAAEDLREALALWRGPAIADFSFAGFAQTPSARLEELRLVAQEERIDADLALGRHAEAIGELEELVGLYPLRERLRGQLVLALYRSARQAEALQAYQDARAKLVDELGIDPSQALQDLERAVLNQDPALDLPTAPLSRPEPGLTTPERSILILPRAESLDELVELAAPLARARLPHELILARLVEADGLGSAVQELQEKRALLEERGVATRVAAFTSSDWSEDAVRLASQQEVDLLLVAEPDGDLAAELDDGPLRRVLDEAPCDVGVVVSGDRAEGPVLVPFGGAEHEWGALELGAWLASASGDRLYLVGTEGSEEEGRRDASRLLATAALAVQQLAGVVTEPVLVAPGAGGVLEAASAGSVIVLGLSTRWRDEGLGPTRTEVLNDARMPVIVVRRGVRPGGLTPKEDLTRFTWSLGAPR